MRTSLRELELALTPTQLKSIGEAVKSAAAAVFGVSEAATPSLIFSYDASNQDDRFQVLLQNSAGFSVPTHVALHPLIARTTQQYLERLPGDKLEAHYKDLGIGRWDMLNLEMARSAMELSAQAIVQAYFNDSAGAVPSDEMVDNLRAILDIVDP